MEKPDNQPQPGQPTHSSAGPGIGPGVDPTRALREVSQALLVMRDGLTRLSLALKDWQFEHDLTRRASAQDVAQSLFASLVGPAHPVNRTNSVQPPGRDASEG